MSRERPIIALDNKCQRGSLLTPPRDTRVVRPRTQRAPRGAPRPHSVQRDPPPDAGRGGRNPALFPNCQDCAVFAASSFWFTQDFSTSTNRVIRCLPPPSRPLRLPR